MRALAAVEPKMHRRRDLAWSKQLGMANGRSDWSFVYVFFSNGTPFDAPNRSETCRTA